MTTQPTEYICIKDDQLQAHSRKIERLEARSESREETINEIKKEIDKMDKKLDAILQGFNDFKMQSTHDDTQLELRLKTIETKLEANEKAIQEARDKEKENRGKITTQVAIIGLIFSAIMILIAILPFIID